MSTNEDGRYVEAKREKAICDRLLILIPGRNGRERTLEWRSRENRFAYCGRGFWYFPKTSGQPTVYSLKERELTRAQATTLLTRVFERDGHIRVQGEGW